MQAVDIDNQKNMPLSNYVGALIRNARIRNGLTGSELAKMVYLSQQQISRYERGQNGFQLDILFRILSALNMNDSEIKTFFCRVVDKNKKVEKPIEKSIEDYFN